MSTDIRPGQRVLYQSMEALVKDITHSQIYIQVGGAGAVRSVRPSEVIPIVDPDSAYRQSEVAAIDPKDWNLAERRATVIRRILTGVQPRTDAVIDGAHELGITPRQVWRLLKDYDSHESVSGLVLQAGGRTPGIRVLDPAVERIIAIKRETEYLVRERPPVTELVESIATACRDQGLKPPARQTVQSRLDAMSDRDADRRRNGAKAARYRHQPMPGHVEVTRPLERVEIDHTPMDVMVCSDDPLCDYVGRPWLTIAIDVYTRCILGVHIAFDAPSILSVAICVTHVVLPKLPLEEFGVPLPWPMHGTPELIVSDNAKEFGAQAFLRGCKDLNIKVQFRPEGSPHYGGTIERLIGSFMGQCHLLPGTTKNSVRAKGDYDSARHACLTLSQSRTWFVEQVLGRYHQRLHRELGTAPAIAWERVMGSAHGH